MKQGDVVWVKRIEMQPLLAIIQSIEIQGDGTTIVHMKDVENGQAHWTEYVNKIVPAKRLPEHLCYELPQD